MISPSRTSAIVAGAALAAMAVLAPISVLVLLPEQLGIAALLLIFVVALDVLVAIYLWPFLRAAGELLALSAVAMRLIYAAVFGSAVGILAHGNEELFHRAWDTGLFLFGVHLLLAGSALIRGRQTPKIIGFLLLVAGAGYLVDSALVLVKPEVSFEVSAITFVGEVVLIVWLLGWAGRSQR